MSNTKIIHEEFYTVSTWPRLRCALPLLPCEALLINDVSSDCLGGELDKGVEDPAGEDSTTAGDWCVTWDGECEVDEVTGTGRRGVLLFKLEEPSSLTCNDRVINHVKKILK